MAESWVVVGPGRDPLVALLVDPDLTYPDGPNPQISVALDESDPRRVLWVKVEGRDGRSVTEEDVATVPLDLIVRSVARTEEEV